MGESGANDAPNGTTRFLIKEEPLIIVDDKVKGDKVKENAEYIERNEEKMTKKEAVEKVGDKEVDKVRSTNIEVKRKKLKKKNKRGGNKKKVYEKFKIIYNNIRGGYRKKEESIKFVINQENPTMIILLETFLEEGEKIDDKFFDENDYETIRMDRQEKYGGGILIIYKKKIKNILTVESVHNNEYEGCWLCMDNRDKVKVKIGIIYAPQESRTDKTTLKRMYNDIESQVQDARVNGFTTVIVGDFNCKVGEAIEGNHKDVSKAGNLMIKMIEEAKLELVNASEKCEGKWTREEAGKKSIIDYVLCTREDAHVITKVMIDEEKT